MNKLDKRLGKIEGQLPAQNQPPLFMSGQANPWTEAEKAEMLQQHPECDFFWKCLSEVMPSSEIARRQQEGIPLDDLWSPFIAGRATAGLRKRMHRFATKPDG